jgi:hypothetical protein
MPAAGAFAFLATLLPVAAARRVSLDLDFAAVRALPTTAYWRYMPYTRQDHLRYAANPAGRDPYRLLAYLGAQLQPGQYAVELGTHVATSAFALAGATDQPIHTFDAPNTTVGYMHYEHVLRRRVTQINKTMPVKEPIAEFPAGQAHRFVAFPSIIFHVADVLDADKATRTLIGGAALLHLDTLHRPEVHPFEYEFISQITNAGFRGVMILDDIHLNPEMERLWRRLKSQPGTTALDVTAIGHASGTGLVAFGPATVSLRNQPSR